MLGEKSHGGAGLGRSHLHHRLVSAPHANVRLLVPFLALASACWSTSAFAGDLAVRAEPGVGLPLGGPQGDRFGAGGGGAAKLGLGVAGGYLDLQLGAHGYAFALKQGSVDTPGLVAFGGGARLMRPHDQGTFSPWLDVDGLYVRTGPLDRAGIAAAIGAAFAVDRAQSMWIGPFVRYLHVLQPNNAGFDNADGKFLIVGVSAELGGGRDLDPDKDGVLSDVDRCPDVAGPASNQGCPVLDADGDGVLDKDDKCPAQPGPADNAGCPYKDSDKDGVLDREDACPNDPGPASNRGCPIVDTDKDGVPDTEDRCPTQAGKIHGCPDPDGDGLVPPEDQCPDAAGTAADHGCPKYKSVVVTEKKLELGQKIFFAFGKTEILSKSFGLLDEVAQALKDRKSLRVQIEGHTDSVGDADANVKLSQGRADSVVAYLEKKGVARDRMIPKGFGARQPLDTNKTQEGRERNRRVEFVVLDETTATPPTGAAGGKQ